MNRIPVGAVLKSTYAFTFGEIGTVIGLIWIPTLVNAIAYFFVLRFCGETLLLTALNAGPAKPPPEFAYLILYTPLAFLCTAMAGVAISRQVLGLRQGTAVAYVSLGLAEFRAFGGLVALLALDIAYGLVASLALSLLDSAAGAVVGVNLAFAVAATLLQIYLLVRLSFLLIASIAGGDRLGLTRSWVLTAGNFWRIAGIGAATIVPVAFLYLIVVSVLLGPEYAAVANAMAQDPDHPAKYAAQIARIVVDHAPQLLGLGLVIAPIVQGLMFASAAFAYRALTGKAVPLPG